MRFVKNVVNRTLCFLLAEYLELFKLDMNNLACESDSNLKKVFLS